MSWNNKQVHYEPLLISAQESQKPDWTYESGRMVYEAEKETQVIKAASGEGGEFDYPVKQQISKQCK